MRKMASFAKPKAGRWPGPRETSATRAGRLRFVRRPAAQVRLSGFFAPVWRVFLYARGGIPLFFVRKWLYEAIFFGFFAYVTGINFPDSVIPLYRNLRFDA